MSFFLLRFDFKRTAASPAPIRIVSFPFLFFVQDSQLSKYRRGVVWLGPALVRLGVEFGLGRTLMRERGSAGRRVGEGPRRIDGWMDG